MGMTDVKMIVKNPRDPSKKIEAKFLVDSGATYTVVPESLLKKIGIKPQREEEFSLADGTLIKRKVGNALYLILDPLKRELHKAMLRM